MFTTAEQRAIGQLSGPGGRLAVLAADQRTKLVQALEGASLPSDLASMQAFKLDLVAAMAPLAPAMLLDPEIALPHVVDAGALPPRTGVLVSLERSGSRRTPEGLRAAELLPDVGAAGVRALGGTGAKLLIRLRADREDGDGANGELLRRAVVDCASQHLLLIVEVLIFRLDDESDERFAELRPRLIREAALLAESCGARYLKLEYPGSETACREITDALSCPWALLSAGVDHETFTGQLRAALSAGASGFIAGRSIWKEAMTLTGDERRRFLEGDARRRLEELLATAARY
jgi:tagatose 1,6-diphosphate aldolase